jgi:predicted dehydrogenase
MDTVRFGIIGLGNMGSFHAETVPLVKNARLTAVSDANPQRLEAVALKTGAKGFTNYEELLDSGLVDAVLIATPHYFHPPIALAAFDRGQHVLCEKPLAVSVKAAREVVAAAARKPQLKFGMMLQLRTFALYRKLREVIADGELGEITRVTWIVTDWFRTWAYYASGGWRATWTGEGGGVLINQCPHNLDLIQWITGLVPNRVTAVGFVGKTHPIEVEDEVSAIIEYPTGATGHFITTTGEAPGTNRLEIVGDRGRIVAEAGRILFTRTRRGVREIRETSREAFVTMETWDIDIPHKSSLPEGHQVVHQNFVNAVLKGEELIATGADGLRQLELGNAMLMSALTRRPVDMPIDGDEYEKFLQDMVRQYGGRKSLETDTTVSADMLTSFKHR